jgi:hypothetical protein
MGFFSTLRERHQSSRKRDIERMAEDVITLTDFKGTVYFAHQGIPLVPVKDEWSPKEIVNELARVRNDYICARMEENGLDVSAL